ncbi:MAG: HisA/HisF-related TIM barrel protein, partial [Myxococcales bacterium]
MELIPAIDLLDGKVVRLHQGNYDRVTVYDDDPVSMAKRFEEQGAARLHVVDLEGARRGNPAH